MRKLYFELSEAFLKRLANVAEAERRNVRVQATVCLEQGIVQLEHEYGLADPQLPPRIIEGVFTASSTQKQDDASARQDIILVD